MSSVKEIARRLGLSTATISRAFDPRHAEKVRPETRERIYALCEQENFRPGIIGRCFTTGKTFKIGILIGADDDNSSTYWRQLFASVSNAVSSCGYVPLLLSISNWENAEKTMTEYFRSGMADGYLLTGLFRDYSAFLSSCRPNVPLLVFDPFNVIDLPFTTLYRDAVSAYRRLWEAVLPEHRGGTLLVWFGFSTGKRQALLSAKPAGADVAELMLTSDPGSVAFRRDKVVAELRSKLPELRRHKVFWCVTDTLAYCVIEVLESDGLTVGTDFFVAGFDNLEGHVKGNFVPELTTVEPHWKEGGEQAVRMLMAQINGNFDHSVRSFYRAEAIFRRTLPAPDVTTEGK